MSFVGGKTRWKRKIEGIEISLNPYSPLLHQISTLPLKMLKIYYLQWANNNFTEKKS